MQVVSVAPLRDLRPDADVAQMRAALHAWSGRCAAILESLETHMAQVRAVATARARAGGEATDKMNLAMAELRDGDKKVSGTPLREQLTRRAMNKRLMPDAAAKAKVDEAMMDLDGPFPGEDGKKRASKRKM